MKYRNSNNLIEGIRNQDKKVLQDIYSDYFPTIKRFVVENNGTEQDAKDVFQDAIIIIYRKIKEGTFDLSSSFKTYIYSVCRFIWLKELKKNTERAEKDNLYVEYEDIPEVTIDEYEQNEQYKLYQLHFKRLSEDCQTLLQLFLKKVPLKEIAQKLGIDSMQFIKRKKYKCKEQLIRYIKSDPKFNDE